MPVRRRGHDLVEDKPGGGLDVLLVTGRAEAAALAGEGQEVLVLAMVAANPGETALEVAAFQDRNIQHPTSNEEDRKVFQSHLNATSKPPQ